MRNLKRALSLTLASVMLLGMMVLGTSAASYPDVTDEHNVEAIGVLQAVGVMSGSNNGNFNPDAKISRIEMAIVMANLLNLEVNYFQGQNTFSDVPEWASGYVNACAANGIVTGVGGGRFGTGNVTATQAALMMLKALGYFQYNSDFGGDWARATALQASKIRLFDGIDAQDNTQLDRNQVAQLALNALKADTVDPDASGNLNITTPDGTTVTTGNVNYVVRTTDAAFANAIDDSATSNSGSSIDGRSGKIIQLGEQLYNGDLKLDKDVPDDFGRPSNTWTYKNDKIGTYANKTERIASYDTKVSRGDLYSLLSSTVRKSLSDGDSDLTVWVDGVEINGTNAATYGALSPAAPGNYWDRANSAAVYTMPNTNGTSRRGTLTEVYLDKDNNVDIAIINTYVFKATGDYSSSRDEVRVAPTADTKITLADLAIKGEDLYVENVKDGDYLLITATRNTNGTYDAQTLAVAEKVQGTVTTYTEKDTVTIGETKYSYSAICSEAGGKENVKATTYTVGQDAIVVLDSFGNIIAVDEARASSSFVFIDKIASTSGLSTKAVASAYFTDGTEAEITLKEVAGEKSASNIIGTPSTGENSPYDKTWYNYSVGENGEYTLYAVNTTKYPSGTQDAEAKSANVATSGTPVSIKLMESGKVNFLFDSPSVGTQGSAVSGLGNDKTIAVVKDNVGDVATYNGVKAIPDITVTGKKVASPSGNQEATAYYLENNNGYIDYVFVNLDGVNSSVAGGEEDSSFLYVVKSKNPVYVNNSRTYFPYETVDADGNKTVSNFDGYLNGVSGDVYDLYYKTRTNSNGDITNEVKVTNDGKYFNHDIANGAVSIEGNALKIGTHNYMLNGNSKVILVAKKTSGINMNADAAYEVYSCPAGSGLESYFNGYTFSGKIAGATLSSTSAYIDTLFITADTRAADATGITLSKDSMTIDVGGTDTATLTGATVTSVGSSAPAVATATNSGNTITVTGVAAGSATITVNYQNAAGVAGNKTIAVTVAAAKTADELAVEAAITALEAKTGSDVTLAAQDTAYADLDAQDAAAKTQVGVLVGALTGGAAGVAVDTTKADDGFTAGYKFAATADGAKAVVNGVDTGDADAAAGADGISIVTVALKKGDATGEATITFTAKAQAFKDNSTANATAAAGLSADKTAVTNATVSALGTAPADESAAETAAINAVQTEVEKLSLQTGNTASYAVKTGSYNGTTGTITVTVTITYKNTGMSEAVDKAVTWTP